MRDPDDVVLPPRHVLAAGMKKFQEMARLHWPLAGGADTFSIRNDSQLFITLGLVYMAMREVDK